MTDLSKTASKHFSSSVERKSSTHSYKSVRPTKLLEMDEVRSEDLSLHNCVSTAAASGLDLVGKLIERACQATRYSRGASSCGGTSSVFAAVSALFQTWMAKVCPLINEVKIQLAIPDKMRKMPMIGDEIYRVPIGSEC